MFVLNLLLMNPALLLASTDLLLLYHHDRMLLRTGPVPSSLQQLSRNCLSFLSFVVWIVFIMWNALGWMMIRTIAFRKIACSIYNAQCLPQKHTSTYESCHDPSSPPPIWKLLMPRCALLLCLVQPFDCCVAGGPSSQYFFPPHSALACGGRWGAPYWQKRRAQ